MNILPAEHAPAAMRESARPRGVLMVSNFLSASGGNRGVCEELAARLAAAGWPVVTTSAQPRRLPRLADMLTTVWRRRRQYDVAQVDVFSGPAFRWAEAVCQALCWLEKPYVLTLHGGSLPQFAARRPRRVRRLLYSAALVTTPSRFLREELAPYAPALRLLPNPLDLKQYPFRPRREPRPRLVWLRALHRVYNPVLAVQTLAAVQRKHPEARLIMVGPDKGDGSLQEVRQAAANLGVAESVTLAGGVPKQEVPHWLHQGDIFLNTTNVDNTPVSVIEALACGTCVVSTSVGGIPYLLEHGTDALLTAPRDAADMAAAVERLLGEPGLALRLSENGRHKVASFDWSRALPDWQSVLTEACGSRGPAGRTPRR